MRSLPDVSSILTVSTMRVNRAAAECPYEGELLPRPGEGAGSQRKNGRTTLIPIE